MKESYLNFDEYIRQGEPEQQEKAAYWQTAIGLQAVDGLKTSDYLQNTARRHIEGEITIDYDLEQERAYSYKGKNHDEMISHLTHFISGLWQIHAFSEGNTRTTAVFCIQYLRSLGFDVDNDQFAKHSWYFRNALERANYHNITKGIDYTPIYLERFFRNLLLGEQWDLRNRYLHIHPTEEWREQPNMATPTSTPTSTPQAPDKLPDKFNTKNQYVNNLVMIVGTNELSVKEMLSELGLKDRESFMDVYLNPAIKGKFVRLLYPDSPRHPRQKYLLTVKGLTLYKELINKNEN